jgi:GR25 family glycosyltransferase involved in LPS biosynthesis
MRGMPTTLNNLFQKIYVINLARRKDRKLLSSKKLDSFGIRYEYFEGIDGYSPQYDSLCDSVLTREDTWIKSRGAVGLILTYINILEDAMKKNYENILIFEDDICFHKDFSNMLNNAAKDIDFSKADSIWLGANQYRFDDQQKAEIMNQDLGYYTVSKKEWHYTFGTYAIAFNKKFIQLLRKSIDLSSMLYAIDVHIFWTLAENNLVGRVIKPFLILPDVTDSDNMGARDQSKFMMERMYKAEDYKFISMSILTQFKKVLDKYRVSLRHIFSDYRSGSTIVSRDTFDNIMNKIVFNDEKNITPIKTTITTFTDQFFGYFSKDNTIDIVDLFDIIEEKKSFVYIIPSFNNIDNYKINLDSIRKQIYPNYQHRVIYIDDMSEDSTRDAVKEYVKKYNLGNCFDMIEMNTRQRQGMARYIAFHQCFDDEICLNLDGDDWLYNENVLSVMNDHYTKNDILVSYGSYYIYDEQDVALGQSMGIPYGGKLMNVRQYPDEIKAKKTFRHYDWICGHLRSAYAKLFKTIELKHYVGPDGFFFRMASDFGEMIPVLEMAQTRHLNVVTPTLVYNKYNSRQFATSFYNMNAEDNKDSKVYREVVTKMIKSRPYYPRINGAIKIARSDTNYGFINNNEFLGTNKTELVERLTTIKEKYVLISTEYVPDLKDSQIYKDLISLATSVPFAIIFDQITKDDHDGAVVQLDNKREYAVKKTAFTLNGLASGFYNKDKLINILKSDKIVDDEITLVPFLLSKHKHI